MRAHFRYGPRMAGIQKSYHALAHFRRRMGLLSSPGLHRISPGALFVDFARRNRTRRHSQHWPRSAVACLRWLHMVLAICEPFHLFRYLDEQAFRLNERGNTDMGRFLKGIV